MNCLKCGAKNPMTVTYCQACGARMDLTADEIRQSYVDKRRGEKIESGEKQGEHALLFGAAALLVAITVFLAIGPTPDEDGWIPSVSNGSKYVEVDFKPKVQMPKLRIPMKRQTAPGQKEGNK